MFSFIRIALVVLLLAGVTFGTAHAQQGVRTDDSRKYELIVVTNDQPSQADQALVTSLTQNPHLASIASKCKLHLFKPGSELFRQRYATALPTNELPVIALARWDGGVIYKASGSHIPPPDQLADKLKQQANLANAAEMTVQQSIPLANNSGIQWPTINSCPTCPQDGINGPRFPNVPFQAPIPETFNVNPQINFPGDLTVVIVCVVVGAVLLCGLGFVGLFVLALFLRQ